MKHKPKLGTTLKLADLPWLKLRYCAGVLCIKDRRNLVTTQQSNHCFNMEIDLRMLPMADVQVLHS